MAVPGWCKELGTASGVAVWPAGVVVQCKHTSTQSLCTHIYATIHPKTHLCLRFTNRFRLSLAPWDSWAHRGAPVVHALGAPVRRRRGPGLGGPSLRKSPDSSQTRGSVPIADRPSVHCVPVIAGSLKLMELEGSVKERSQTRVALALERYKTAAHGDVERTPKKDGAPVTFRSLT